MIIEIVSGLVYLTFAVKVQVAIFLAYISEKAVSGARVVLGDKPEQISRSAGRMLRDGKSTRASLVIFEGSVRELASRANLTVDFRNFTAIHAGEDRHIQHSSVAGRPAWLDGSGDITPEAADFFSEEDKRSDRTLSPKKIAKQIPPNVGPRIYSLIRINAVLKEYRPASLQRSWQIGAVLQRKR